MSESHPPRLRERARRKTNLVLRDRCLRPASSYIAVAHRVHHDRFRARLNLVQVRFRVVDLLLVLVRDHGGSLIKIRSKVLEAVYKGFQVFLRVFASGGASGT